MSGFLLLLLISGIIILLYFLAKWRSAEAIGKRGEEYVARVLQQLPEGYLTLNDVVLPTKNDTTQIDHIVVSPNGVFAIETKNYRGEIYGNDSREQWTQMIITEVTYSKKWWKTYTYVTKNHLYNPVKQAIGHTYPVKNILKEHYSHVPVIPIVVFSGEAVLKISTSHNVVYVENLIDLILSFKDIYLPREDIPKVMELIALQNIRDKVDNKTHVRNIRQNEAAVMSKISQGICPKCGGNLVERHGQYGRFLGCSNYPKCKYTYNL